MKTLKLLIIIVFFATSIYAQNIKTPSDVYAQAVLLKHKVQYLRKLNNINSKFPVVPKQYNKTPGHVLQKSLETLSKINKYRVIKNYGEISMPSYPSRNITPSDVYEYVSRLNDEITQFIDDDKFIKSLNKKVFYNKTPSDVYTLLWSISVAFDPLLGSRGFTPTEVYQESERIVAIAKFLRNSQLVFTKVEKPKVKETLHPNHALNTSYKLLRKIASIQSRLWLTHPEIPTKVFKETTPSHVHDSLQNILVEMQRIKTRLGLERSFKIKEVIEDKTSSDVVENLLYAIALLPEFEVTKPLVQYDKNSLNKTPNEVFAISENILRKLNLLANYKGINLNVKRPPYIYDLKPKHVYQKAMESLEKTIKLKRKEGFYKSKVPTYPFKNVTPSEVYELVDRLDYTITLILKRNYDSKVSLYKYNLRKEKFNNKVPSDVYNNIWIISRTLDQLLGSPYTPNETYLLAKDIENKVLSILNHFHIKDEINNKDLDISTKSPKEVFEKSLELYSVFTKILKRANIKGENITIPRESVITPNSVYNSLRIIIASINEFQILYEIENVEILNTKEITNKTPTDVYKVVENSINKLNGLFKNENY